ncbi:MAG: hypothetical protein A2782_00555 [Candidatus Blackburnbacteria bacterium RIFCSPHIGHO2_01_FULL_43_15b]|uniref:Glucanase n=1 Tax=Candidatus Blackburnbacteria bacterium RIFCSPHIGHO2_01_FULL_43_15b TaxID=1797513 RepID=A0A1G1UYN8_9BACT|nr:MAG: hypothetical protein A2782_00555 [Candidatus Blackburnbacteria bacterium RIFCSPHIGHO2_01_FULL_43_15b]
MKKILGLTCLTLATLIFVYVFYNKSENTKSTRTFSNYTILSSTWEKYKGQFIQNDGRIIDYNQNAITTSEGQSYALLRAVWSDDKDTFDLVWKWTRENLKRKSDNLSGWKWGQRQDKTFGFLENGGDNSASDADTDIALSLILAGKRWGHQSYIDQAKPVLNDVWAKEVVRFQSKNYLSAGNWANLPSEIVLNPSYFTPYAWRLFAQTDNTHDWNSLINPAYDLLDALSGLPPDWVSIDKSTGQLKSPSVANLTTNYSYDAMRIPWRITVDYQWNKEERALNYLSSAFKKLRDDYLQNGKLPTSYSRDGNVINGDESPLMYSTALGYFKTTNQNLAEKIYQEKIIQLYSNDTNSFKESLPYYEQNWLWFGAALYNNKIIPF